MSSSEQGEVLSVGWPSRHMDTDERGKVGVDVEILASNAPLTGYCRRF